MRTSTALRSVLSSAPVRAGALLAAVALVACGDDGKAADTAGAATTTDEGATSDEEAAAAVAQLEALLAEQATEAEHLDRFDDLDFEVFSGQEWDRLSESHAADIVVHWPDGHSTTGIDVHIADLQAMFVWAPDTRIEVHPIKLASGDYTAVTGVMEGTFTEPMPLGDGTFIEPTGQAYRIDMATIGLWNADGVMSEEWLFWDNATFMSQIGLGG